MFYSMPGEPQPVYMRDEDGNILYITLPDGTKIPQETGQFTNGYSEPTEFWAVITSSGGKATDETYGVDLSGYDALLYFIGDEYKFTEQTLIWYESEPTMLEDGSPDPEKADYIIRRVPPHLNETVYLMEKIAK